MLQKNNPLLLQFSVSERLDIQTAILHKVSFKFICICIKCMFIHPLNRIMKAGLKGTIPYFPASIMFVFFFPPTSFLFTAMNVLLISVWGIIFAFLLICLSCISVDTRGESESIYLSHQH